MPDGMQLDNEKQTNRERELNLRTQIVELEDKLKQTDKERHGTSWGEINKSIADIKKELDSFMQDGEYYEESWLSKLSDHIPSSIITNTASRSAEEEMDVQISQDDNTLQCKVLVTDIENFDLVNKKDSHKRKKYTKWEKTPECIAQAEKNMNDKKALYDARLGKSLSKKEIKRRANEYHSAKTKYNCLTDLERYKIFHTRKRINSQRSQLKRKLGLERVNNTSLPPSTEVSDCDWIYDDEIVDHITRDTTTEFNSVVYFSQVGVDRYIEFTDLDNPNSISYTMIYHNEVTIAQHHERVLNVGYEARNFMMNATRQRVFHAFPLYTPECSAESHENLARVFIVCTYACCLEGELEIWPA